MLTVSVSLNLMEEVCQSVVESPIVTFSALLVLLGWWRGDPPTGGVLPRAAPFRRPGGEVPPPPAPDAHRLLRPSP